MKKQLLTFGFLTSLAAFGQTFTDDFDSYTAGQKLCPQSGGAWTTWSNAPGGTEDVLVSNADAASGANSLYFATSVQAGGPTDLVRNFGVLNTGQFEMNFNMKVETGKAGYFNLQRNATIGQVWAMDCFFNDNGTISIVNQDGLNFTGATYPQGGWFNFKLAINFNTNHWEVFIDYLSVGSFANPINQIASIDIYPTDQNAPYSCGYFIDDFHYEITPYTLPSLNGAVNGLVFDQGLLAGNIVTPQVTVRNLGTTPITSFDVDVDYNGNTISQTVTGLNLASLASTTVTMNGTLTIAAGNIPMVATVSNVNGGGADDDSDDDSLTINLDPLVPAMGKMVVGEEGTGTWCVWCPRGAVFMDLMETKYEHYWAGIAVHNGDTMTNEIYDAGMGGLIAGYPSALIDRLPEVDPSEMEEDFLARIQVAPKAVITNGATWNATTRELKVSTSANFLAAANNNYRLGIVLTEDEVTGTTGFSQANAYAGGGNGTMGGFESLPNPVPAAQMVYNHVARAIKPSFTGYINSFPGTVNIGETHTITATFILPASWDETKIHIIGLLFDPSGKIDNAGKATIPEAVTNGFVTGTDVTAGLNDLSQVDDMVQVYPNPATTAVSVSLQIKEQSEVTISVTDIAGKEISSKNYGQLNGSSIITINTSNTPVGVYFVNVKMNNAVTQKKVIIQ
ncbi:MAG: hypothetical protein K0S23_3521 [Fluviicola sp.]|jgi:hypothetical protein|uniref:T9SS type A sorting domain-containing protein n=1 Tax=Fluviicola sp. TaxID=1917219 RepID=UPI002630A26A|nr:T9SS type A sorting domain-containing protein [Fluviicola sp.]MDF3029214.1 hypothetical protein [Fluviicola sp.]